MNRLLVVASSPHIHSSLTTQKIMAWVLIALAPAGIAGTWFFGPRAAIVMAVCVITCVAAEAFWQRASKKTVTVSDLSAAVTGLLLAYNLPPSIPIWMAVIGSLFAIIVVKQFFGGLGQNIVNPALAARAMMLTSWPVAMSKWGMDGLSAASGIPADTLTGATPLAIIKGLSEGTLPSLFDVFIGRVGGCLGETSALALIAGGCILIAKGIISWRIPAVYIGTVAALSFLLGRDAGALYEIMAGGLMLGAFFMATDYTTNPMTDKGHIIFAAGCGLLTMLIRAYGGYPEGVSYSILIMNLTVPIIDRFTLPKPLGEVSKNG